MEQKFFLQKATNGRIIVSQDKSRENIALLISSFPGESANAFSYEYGPIYGRERFVNLDNFPELKDSAYFAFEYLSTQDWEKIVPLSTEDIQTTNKEILPLQLNTNPKKYWLMKSEPEVYSIADLKREKETLWDGVRNYQARNFLREMKEGDLAFFYHSNTKPPAIVGLMEIVKSKIADPSQFDPKSDYYDSKSDPKQPRWQTVKVKFIQEFSQGITLQQLKEKFSEEQLLLVRKGNRLSVMPLPEKVATEILGMV